MDRLVAAQRRLETASDNTANANLEEGSRQPVVASAVLASGPGLSVPRPGPEAISCDELRGMSDQDRSPTSWTFDISTRIETLPSPPFVAMEIIRITRDPESSASDLARALTQDPVLAARLLQVANSAAYGVNHAVTSIERATALLGFKAVKMMALSFSLASDVTDAGVIALDQYWYHSLLSAETARRWAELLHPALVEEAFLAGLLSHLGRLILARDNVALYRPVVAQSADGWPDAELEFAMLGFTSGNVTAQLLELWQLPKLITGAVGALHGRTLPEDLRGCAELFAVLKASAITETALTASGGPEHVARLQDQAAVAGMSEEELEPFVIDLDERLRGLADALDVDLPPDTSPQKMLEEARMSLVSVSLSAAVDLHVVERAAEELRVANAELGIQASTDRLTGVPNRAAFDDHLARTITNAVRRGEGSVGLLLFDIDHFKRFNDTYGHQLGDEVLKAVAWKMREVARANELFARYGGEEFALVVSDCVPGDLEIAGERLRRAVEALSVASNAGDLKVTVSGGASHLSLIGDRDAGERLTKAADEALYQAKAEGRNRICGPYS
jgi:diguanylate cyclase (GGDEF)-like protein